MTDGPITFTGLIKFLQYIKGPDHWHYVGETGEPAFQNSWENYSATETTKFIKDASGVVHIQGRIKTGALGDAAFSLPVNYRPEFSIIMASDHAGVYARFRCSSGGDIVPLTGGTTVFSLNTSFYVG